MDSQKPWPLGLFPYLEGETGLSSFEFLCLYVWNTHSHVYSHMLTAQGRKTLMPCEATGNKVNNQGLWEAGFVVPRG